MMGEMLPSAVGVAISPLPIVAVVLMLVTARGRMNGPAFVVGWVIGLTVVGAALFAIAPDVGPRAQSGPVPWVAGLRLGVGTVLLLIALRQWRTRPRNRGEVNMPRWMTALNQWSPLQAAGAGLALSALNPKNLLLAVVGAAAIVRT